MAYTTSICRCLTLVSAASCRGTQAKTERGPMLRDSGGEFARLLTVERSCRSIRSHGYGHGHGRYYEYGNGHARGVGFGTRISATCGPPSVFGQDQGVAS